MTTTVLAGTLGTVGVVGAASPASADGVCAGMAAAQNNRVGNRAPVPAADTAWALAGGTRTISVLANDSDPDGDDLAVVSVDQPARGEVCVDSDGRIEYFAVGSTTGYTDRFTYGVTDGDLYRTATVTVSVQGVKPASVAFLKRKKGSKPAQIRFTNPNNRNLVVLAGSPKRKKPELTRTVAPGKSVALRTKSRKVVYYAIVKDTDGYPILVAVGTLITRTGKSWVQSGDTAFLGRQQGARLSQRQLGGQARAWWGRH